MIMKYFPKLLFAFVVFLLSYNVDAQVGIKFCGQYKYNMIEDATNCYNYGGSMFITKDIKDIKLQVGLSYQSKNFQKEIRYRREPYQGYDRNSGLRENAYRVSDRRLSRL